MGDCNFYSLKDHFKTFIYLNFYIPCLEVEPDLKVKMLHNWREYLHPVFFERGVSIGWHCDFSHVRFATLKTKNNNLS